MHYAKPEALVTTEWLAQHLDDPEVAIIDASWYLPAEQRDPHAEYLQNHIPGAVYDGSWTEWGGRENLPIET